MTDQEYNGFHCGYCKALLPKGRTKWCGRNCSERVRWAKTRKQESERRSRDAYLRNVQQCLHCNNQFVRKLGGNRTDGANSYCSMQCRTTLRAKLRHEREIYKRWSLKPECKQVNAADLIKVLLSLLRKLNAIKRKKESKQAKALRPCVTCSNPVGYAFGRGRLYCSKICKPAEPIEARRAHRQKRKALQRGASRGETINALKVFEQCGWRCQLCSRLTPKQYRGQHKPNSPELDHIKPLSKGGSHTRDNVTLLCRECNGKKSDKELMVQTLLF